jgi:NADH dehydrogenase (ubiquinone) Fe-S protein 1
MIPVYVNNNFVLVSQTASVLEACETVGVTVPRFCYHSQLPIAGNCRMCLVEVEKSPKPVASCAMPVTKNMRIFTDTPLVKKAREGVLEFLLLNHPLDCPICDQGGECDLQDQALTFGSDKSRFFEFKRGTSDKNLGPLVKTIMTRCIHCTRCVRFAAEVAGVGILGTTNRGKETEIGLYVGELMSSELSGNLVDVCPVGALTSKPYAFSSRPWELRSTETLDFSDAVGSNVVVELKETEILRIQPKQNDFVNRVWLSDRGRFSFDGYKNQRLSTPFFKNTQSNFIPLRWKKVASVLKNINKFLILKQSLTNQALFTKVVTFGQLFSKLAVVCTNSASVQDLFTLKQNCSKLGIRSFGHSGTYAPVSELDSNTFFGCSLTVSDLPKTELCILIGTNPRFEAAVFNIQLRKRFTFGLFKTYSVGVPHTPTFATTFTGVSSSFLIKLGEGSSKLCKEVVAKTSAIIAGSSVFKRIDRSLFNTLFSSLKNVANVGAETELTTGFLNRETNAVGAALCGISAINKEDLSNSSVIYLVGEDHNTDMLNSLIQDPNKLIVYQGAHNQFFTNSADLVLPSTSLLETAGLFVSFDGRVQKSNIVSGTVGESKSHSDISSMFSSSLFATSAGAVSIDLFTPALLKADFISDSAETFIPAIKELNTPQAPFAAFDSVLYYTQKQRFARTPYLASVFDFHLINTLTRASKLMVKCSQASRQNHKNFITS